MADENNNQAIILEVEIDEGATEARLVELRKQSEALRVAKEDLKKANKEGKVSAEDYARSLTSITTQERTLSREIREEQKTLDKLIDVRRAANGSLDQSRAILSLVTDKFDGLNDAERENEEIGGRLANTINAVTDKLKSQEEATGRNYRSVGDYLKLVRVGGVSVGEFGDKFKEGTQAVQVFTKGIASTRGALIALTAIPIIALFVGLVALIKSTDEGADKLEQSIGFLTQAFDTLLQGIAPLGNLLVDLFTAPIDTIKSLVTGTDKYKVSLDEVAANAIKAGKAHAEYIAAMQEIEDNENALIVQREKVGLQVDQALLKVKDRSLSEQQKIKILREAGKAEADLAKQTVKNATDAYNEIVKLNKARLAANKKLKDEEQIAEDTAKANVIKAQRESLNTQQAIRNRETAQIEADEATRKENADKALNARKKLAEARVALAEVELIDLKRQGKDTLEQEEKILTLQGQLQSVGLKKNSAQRKLIEAQTNAAIIEARTKHAVELAEKSFQLDSTITATRIALARKGSQAELEAQKQQIEDQQKFDRKAAQDTIKDKQQLKLKLRQIDAQADLAREQLEDNFGKGQIDRAKELADKRLQTEFDLNKQTFAQQIKFQRDQIELEEKHALDLLKLDLENAEKRGLLDLKLQEELKVRKLAIRAKAIKDQKALDQQELEKAKSDALAISEAKLNAVVAGSKKELQVQKEILQKKYELEIATGKKTEDELKRLKEKNNEDNKKLDKAYSDGLVDDIINTVSLAKDTLSTLFEAQSAAIFSALDKQQEAALRSAGTNADLRARIEEKYQAKREQLEKEAARRRQKIASIENLIATATATTEALKLFAKNPVLGAITEALILTKAFAAQSLIDAQTFAKGGVADYVRRYVSDGQGGLVRGPGSGTSDSIPARISNGEAIINARSTAQFYNELSAINSYNGNGRMFSGASAMQPPQMSNFAYGGVQLKPGINVGADVITALKGARFVVAVEDIHGVESDLIYAEAQGSY
ncbi:hypothetical protein IC229_27475 [Spirosoma sp. BT702]|uniref:Tail tape measure protein n=1 Tax=Spirosoma profusum TaxID=2771354 RepID=A0A927AUI0_9BACT|nr:hypothetical protein [Spirosoma profusum]MBD2704412.1 hypothetical protein [Spirosoma profusum]